MVSEFNDIERVLISQNLVRLTDDQIAELINKPVDAVTQYINTITGGGTIKVSKSQKKQLRIKKKVQRVKKDPAKQHLAKVNKELAKKVTRITATSIEQDLRAARKIREARQSFKTKEVDYSQMISVRINSKTSILIKPDQDPEEARKNYLNRMKS